MTFAEATCSASKVDGAFRVDLIGGEGLGDLHESELDGELIFKRRKIDRRVQCRRLASRGMTLCRCADGIGAVINGLDGGAVDGGAVGGRGQSDRSGRLRGGGCGEWFGARRSERGSSTNSCLSVKALHMPCHTGGYVGISDTFCFLF